MKLQRENYKNLNNNSNYPRSKIDNDDIETSNKSFQKPSINSIIPRASQSPKPSRHSQVTKLPEINSSLVVENSAFQREKTNILKSETSAILSKNKRKFSNPKLYFVKIRS